MMTHAQLIQLLGGQAAVGRMLHRHKTTLSRWASNGIPPHAWPIMLRLAEAKGVPLDLEQLADASPRFGRSGKSPYRITAIKKPRRTPPSQAAA